MTTTTATTKTSLTNNHTSTEEIKDAREIDEDLKSIPDWIIELMQHQPTINLMTLGDVSHGKSTLMYALTGEHTSRHGEEKRKNMTIKLGYTSCKIWKCRTCPPPRCYFTVGLYPNSIVTDEVRELETLRTKATEHQSGQESIQVLESFLEEMKTSKHSAQLQAEIAFQETMVKEKKELLEKFKKQLEGVKTGDQTKLHEIEEEAKKHDKWDISTDLKILIDAIKKKWDPNYKPTETTSSVSKPQETSKTTPSGSSNSEIVIQCPNLNSEEDYSTNPGRCQSSTSNGNVILVRHISFVDCPGHAALMGTMISAACVADGALMVVDSSRPCPGPQTVQHMNAAYLLGVLTNDYTDQPKLQNYQNYTKVVVSQNKIDLVDEKEACLHYESIKNFLRSYSTQLATETPILPISAQSKLNIDALLLVITKRLPPFSARLVPKNPSSNSSSSVPRPLTGSHGGRSGPLDGQALRINLIRSFDVNRGRELKEAIDVDEIQGGVVGGVILSGVLRLNQVVEIRPGLILNDDYGNFVVYPIRSHVHQIQCGVQELSEVYSGANVGVQLNIDPFLTKGDRMVGHVMIAVDVEDNSEKKFEGDADDYINQQPFVAKPPVFYKCVLTYVPLEGYEKAPFKRGETVRLNVGSVKVNGAVTKPKMKINDKVDDKAILVELSSPICADVGSLCTITRNIKKKWVLAAGAVIQSVQSMALQHVGSQM